MSTLEEGGETSNQGIITPKHCIKYYRQIRQRELWSTCSFVNLNVMMKATQDSARRWGGFYDLYNGKWLSHCTAFSNKLNTCYSFWIIGKQCVSHWLYLGFISLAIFLVFDRDGAGYQVVQGRRCLF